MQIKLFKISKRNNSTKRPNYDGNDFECFLKDSTSVVAPVVIMEFTYHTKYYDYNYAYIPDFNRYYFITDIISSGKTWEISLTTDVLATYKDTIGSSSLYVLRSAAAWDGRIIDTYYPVMPTHSEQHQHYDGFDTYVNDIDNGCFVLGIVGAENDGHNIGSVRYYVMPRNSLYKLVDALLNILNDNPQSFDFSDLTEGLQRSLVDPLQFIKSCVWLPVTYIEVADENYGSMKVSMSVDGWTIGSALEPIPNYDVSTKPAYVERDYVFQLIAHPWTGSRGKYMNVSPYTKITLDCPPFGAFDLDTTVLSDASALTARIKIDVITGTGVLEVYADDVLLQRTSSQIGVPVQLSQAVTGIMSGLSGMGSGLLSGAMSLLSGNWFGAIGGLGSTIGSATDMMKPTVTSVGGSGGFVDMSGGISVHYLFYYPVDDDLQNAGRPLCEVRMLSTLPGYQLIMDGDVQISGTAGEQAAVKEFLEGGYFYE